jgi:hypothetical protein
MSQFLDSDGYINVAEFIALARDIDRMAAKEGLKPAEVYFSKKAVVKFDHPSKKKIDAEAFTKKRAQQNHHPHTAAAGRHTGTELYRPGA